jgi:hypothetical protein
VQAAGGGRVSIATDTTWNEGTITFHSAPPIGVTLTNLPQSSRDGTLAAAVTANLNADLDGALTYVLSTSATGLASYASKEAGAAPRLVLAVPCAASPDADGDGSGDPCDCAPEDGAAWTFPVEVSGLRWSDASTLTWNGQAGTLYDVTSGTLASLPVFTPDPDDACVASALPVTAVQEATPPLFPGEGRYFLARARNACGVAPWETASDGRDRTTFPCP